MKVAIYCNVWRGRKMLSPFPVILNGRTIIETGPVLADRAAAVKQGRKLLQSARQKASK